MQVSVSYATQIRRVTGTSSELLEVALSATLQDVIEVACERHGDKLRTALLDSEGQIQYSIMVCLNDQQVTDASKQRVSQGDEVLVVSAISGG